MPNGARRRTSGSVVALVMASCTIFGCGSKGRGDTQAFCSAYVDAARSGAQLVDADLSVTAFQALSAQTEKYASEANRHAPAEIHDEIGRLHATISAFDDRVQRATSTAELEDAVASHVRNQRALDGDATKVDRWTHQHCGITTVPTSRPPTSSASTTAGGSPP